MKQYIVEKLDSAQSLEDRCNELRVEKRLPGWQAKFYRYDLHSFSVDNYRYVAIFKLVR